MPCGPESVGLSKVRPERITKHLEQRYVANGKIAGCLTLVARKGKVAYLDGLGLSLVERRLSRVEGSVTR
jgi:hypothetical protein